MRGGRTGTTMACLSMTLAVLLPGCRTDIPETPDSNYRQALERAVVIGQCTGEPVEAVWTAYHSWYGVASTITGYDMTDEALVLLRQGELFTILGCPAVARASYTLLLQRFPEPEFTWARESARNALLGLPVPPGTPQPLVPPAALRTDTRV